MRDARPRREASAVVKRSLLVAGHATSISLEQAFWDGLRAIAAERGQSVATVVTVIDAARHVANLSSAIRVFVLDRYRDRPMIEGDAQGPPIGPEAGEVAASQ